MPSKAMQSDPDAGTQFILWELVRMLSFRSSGRPKDQTAMMELIAFVLVQVPSLLRKCLFANMKRGSLQW